MRRLKKELFTLNINNYEPGITRLTYPLMHRYADKIGATFTVINKRKFPEWPIDYEKLQIFELGREHGNDWNFYIDSDAIIHPDFFDPTNHVSKDTVMHNGCDFASMRWSYDGYFLRDGRNIGSPNWLAIASDWCLDLWHPLDDLTLPQALANIHPLKAELECTGRVGTEKDHLITDYACSRNIARFGLKFETINNLIAKYDPTGGFLFHAYQISTKEKVPLLIHKLAEWRLLELPDLHDPDSCPICKTNQLAAQEKESIKLKIPI